MPAGIDFLGSVHRLMKSRSAVIAIALIAMHAALLTWSATKNSVMFDEAAHLPAGCTYVKFHEFSVDNYNPPLVPMIAACPVLLAQPTVPDPDPYRIYVPAARLWLYGKEFENANAPRYQHLFLLGRMGVIPISCLGAWLVFAWARQLYGAIAGIAACAMWAFNPDILAHGSIVGADVAVAVAMMAAIWAWIRFCDRPTIGRAMIVGCATGLAHLCKLSAALLWPVFVVLLIFALVRNRRAARDLITGFALTVLITFVLVNLCYGYDRTFEPLRKFEFLSQSMQSLQQRFGAIPVPLPRQLVLGIDSLKWEWEVGYRGYLLGQTYEGGRWNYYPVALACKLPTGMLVLLLMMFGALLWPRARRDVFAWPAGSVFVTLIVLAAGMMLRWQLNIGVRYLLPLYPLSFILISRLFTAQRAIRVIAWGMLGLLIVESLSVAPRFITFFNIIAGGPSRGWMVVNDSNFDWGQDLIDLRKWQEGQHAGRIELAYFGRVDPAIYGIDYVPFGEGTNEQFIAISACFLVGGQQITSSTHRESRRMQIPYYLKLQQMIPVARPGGAIFVFTRDQIESAKRASS